MRVLLYARYSTDLQDPLSNDTQLTMRCRELAQREWTEVGCYTDGSQSGATIHQAGLQALIAAVGTGSVDVVFADAMDRVSKPSGHCFVVRKTESAAFSLSHARKAGSGRFKSA